MGSALRNNWSSEITSGCSRLIEIRNTGFVLLRPPRPPEVDRHPYGAVAVDPALGGEGEDVGDEHGRHLLLVDLIDLVCAVKPGHGATGGTLCLADHERQSVDDEADVGPLLHGSGLVDPLVGDDEVVTAWVFGVDEPHRDVLAVHPEGHGLLAPEPGYEILVRPDEAVGLNGKEDGTEVVDHLVGPVGPGSDIGVQTSRRLTGAGFGLGAVGPTGRAMRPGGLPARSGGRPAAFG